MNKALYIIVAILILAGAGYALTQKPAAEAVPAAAQASNETEQQMTAEMNGTSTDQAVQEPVTATLTLAEVAQHGSESDCWTIVSGKVYDVTSVITTHPGGQKPILESCGKDGTSEFEEMNKVAQGNAMKQLENLFKGDLAR